MNTTVAHKLLFHLVASKEANKWQYSRSGLQILTQLPFKQGVH